METRESGTIASVTSGVEDHGILTVQLRIDLDGGCSQGFGGMCLDNEKESAHHKDYVRDLCDTFGVRSLDDLKGKKCHVLRNFAEWNSEIEGLEAASGKRFTHTKWRRKHWPESKSRLEETTERIQRSIDQMHRRIAEEEQRLATVATRYVSWD